MSTNPQEMFLEEATELLQGMEDALLDLENMPGNEDLINAIFRAAHTIKGTGGVFGFDHVEAFTHVAESVLDKVRDGEIEVDASLVAVLLKCRDHIEKLVESAVADEEIPADDVMENDAELIAELEVYLNEVSTADSDISVLDVALDKVDGTSTVETDNWHISLRFDHEVLQNGMDPLSFLRYLKRLGSLVSVTTINDNLPALSELDPELCYLGFEIDLQSESSKEEIEQVFEFVRDMSQIHILPPQANISRYAQMIDELPDDEKLVGEILVASGALTRNELDQALSYQQETEEGEIPLIGDVLVEEKRIQKEIVDIALQKQTKAKEQNSNASRSLRVDSDKLDKLINLVGELVISGATTNLQAQRLDDEQLLESTSQMSRLVEEIRDNALTLRMVQIGETFKRFQRVVRDVSKELDKNIILEISGAETELDKTVVEKIGDPLMHLVRNAMDHGIESSSERSASAKTEAGILKLNAYHDSGSIIIEVIDDGKGLSKERILAKALQKNIIDSTNNLTDKEIYRLIFEPGFSTAEKVTNLSGRGVGMDVVRRNIEALRGTVDVDSVAGEGTTVSIRLPLTLAIIDGFLVGVDEASYVIPLDSVIECIELDEQERQSAGQGYINLRGEVLPYIRLREVFDGSDKQPERESIVVVQYGTQRAGFVVDELLGELQAVIKPMGKILQGVKGISGTTILGTGNVAVILDVYNLLQRTTDQLVHHTHGSLANSAAVQASLH
ncbi:MAG: chemotaxis protein CheA [Gammaproteobacteria bacterium]|nr:chemotaxis protein CheA [Gammaproteobacteria bacterium]